MIAVVAMVTNCRISIIRQTVQNRNCTRECNSLIDWTGVWAKCSLTASVRLSAQRGKAEDQGLCSKAEIRRAKEDRSPRAEGVPLDLSTNAERSHAGPVMP